MKIRRLFQDLPLSLVSLGSLGLLAAPILQAAPAAQEHPTSALSDAIWQPGIALDSQDNALAGRTITATGAAWPNGSTTYQTQTAADGSFRVAFAPGTARGLVQLEGAPEFLGAPVWRPWYQHEIVLRGSKPRQVRVPVVDYGTEPRQSPRVWVRQFSWDGISEQTSLPWGDPIPIGDPWLSSLWVDYLVEAENRVRTRYVQDEISARKHAESARVPLCDEARLSGSLGPVGAAPRGPIMVYCDQPVRHFGEEEYFQTWVSEDGRFDLRVPASIPLSFTFAAQGMTWEYSRERPLKPGEHRSDLFFGADFGPVLEGRVLQSNGTPLAGAQVIGLKNWLDNQFFIRPLGEHEAHHALTDAEGRFQLSGFYFSKELVLMVVAPRTAQDSVGLSKPILGTDRLDWHRVQIAGGHTGDLVFQPKTSAFQLLVQDVDGQPLSDYHLHWVQRDQTPPPVSGGIACGVKSDEGRLQEMMIEAAIRGWEFGRIEQGLSYPATHFGFEHAGPFPEGRFALANMPAGEWSLTVSAPGFAPQRVPDFKTPRKDELKVTLQRPASLKVRLLDDLGHPVSGQSIRLYQDPAGQGLNSHLTWTGTLAAGNSQSGEAPVSDSEGWITLPEVAPGQHRLAVVGTWHSQFPSKLITLLPRETQRIEWRAQTVGSAMIAVDPRLIAEMKRRSTMASARVVLRATADEEKKWTGATFRGTSFLAELPVGSYTVHYESLMPNRRIPVLAAPLSIEIVPRQTTHATLGLDDSLSELTGLIQKDGQPLDWGQLLFESEQGSASYRCQVNSAGQFQICLPSGVTYRARVWTRAKSWAELGEIHITESAQHWVLSMPMAAPQDAR